MKKRRTNASAPRQKRPEKTAREQAWQRFLRQNTWLVLLLVLILVAVVLFICVITGAPDEPVADTAQTGSRYRTAYICAETPTVPCYDAGFAETGAVARGSAVTIFCVSRSSALLGCGLLDGWLCKIILYLVIL